MMKKVDEHIVRAAVYGGAFYGGGGGGDIATGLKYGLMAIELGDLYIIDISTVQKKYSSSLVLTASILGAPSARQKHVTPSHIVRSAEIILEELKEQIAGFITAENGGFSSVNGWIPAALLNFPIIDAPADGRAHPTGVMGSMGLHRLKEYVSIQAAVGGNPETGSYVEILAKGSIAKVDKIMREASVQAGGLVAITRNPVPISYVKTHAAPEALSKAIAVGEIILKQFDDVEKKIDAITSCAGGKVVDRGIVETVKITTVGGYDVGKTVVKGEKEDYELSFFNEYMTLENTAGKRYATFPDLITTLDAETCIPVTTAELKEGMKIHITIVPKERVPLGAGVKDVEQLRFVENIIEKRLVFQ
ncbi:MAG: DUF917 family protein [Candidatus Caldarchaeum sp.]